MILKYKSTQSLLICRETFEGTTTLCSSRSKREDEERRWRSSFRRMCWRVASTRTCFTTRWGEIYKERIWFSYPAGHPSWTLVSAFFSWVCQLVDKVGNFPMGSHLSSNHHLLDPGTERENLQLLHLGQMRMLGFHSTQVFFSSFEKRGIKFSGIFPLDQCALCAIFPTRCLNWTHRSKILM